MVNHPVKNNWFQQKESVILADCKGQCKLFDVADMCFIDMAKEEISVSQ